MSDELVHTDHVLAECPDGEEGKRFHLNGLDTVPETEEEEDTDAYDAFDSLTPYEKWQHDALLRVMGENQALVEEVRAARTDIADLRAYVGELEQRAQDMASPEKMQEAMNKMMGGMLG